MFRHAGYHRGGRAICPSPSLPPAIRSRRSRFPFEASGIDCRSPSTRLPAAADSLCRLNPLSPAILVEIRRLADLIRCDHSGTPLDAANPARSRSRIQIMATGLGRVTPDWPAGVDAPIDNPPTVVADVRAMLDGAPVHRHSRCARTWLYRMVSGGALRFRASSTPAPPSCTSTWTATRAIPCGYILNLKCDSSGFFSFLARWFSGCFR